jgi:hypothetical protein
VDREGSEEGVEEGVEEGANVRIVSHHNNRTCKGKSGEEGQKEKDRVEE